MRDGNGAKAAPTLSAPPYWEHACDELASRDEILSRLIETHRDDVLRGSGDAFRTLVNAIVGQQISVAAAAGIWRRLLCAYPDLTPAALADAAPEELRAAGLSNRKAGYLRSIAEAFLEGRTNASVWSSLDDDELRKHLTAFRGIGPWTADMVLIFHAGRPDVLPLGDLGLVNAAARLYGWDGDPSRADRLREHAERWRPWRTVATWFVWRDLDAEPVIY